MIMADFPCLPLWTDAYLADTTHLRTEEHGAYLLLLMAAWRRADCSLPDDDEILARTARLPLSKWKAIRPVLEPFWKVDKRRKILVQKRLKKEREFSQKKREQNRHSAVSRWKKTKIDDANAMPPLPIPNLKEKTSVFSKARERAKPKNWIHKKTHTEAVAEVVEEIENHERRRIEISRNDAGETVRRLPSVG